MKTVKVKKDNARGYHIRNECDVTKDDVLFEEGPKPAKKKTATRKAKAK